ncbi:MAG: M20/M25/M40 family metallo-hydrolase [Planctomycetota bacterium]|nr:MAG: M20/M25/M40 family metallo-hydrolase [Planctomycetota bacterium]
MLKMPGKSYKGPLMPLTADQLALRDQLRNDVETLARQIGERNIWKYTNLTAAADFIENSLNQIGYKTSRQNFSADGKTCSNIEAELKGSSQPDRIIIIGAHYDTVLGSPGANDNASAVAANLALARHFKAQSPTKTLRFVFFANEEPPFFQTLQMGSQHYAKACRQKNENIIAMLSLETIGYYTDEHKTQNYPPPLSLFYPSTGNFLGFVGNLSSRKLLYKAIASFRDNCKFPSEGGAFPSFVPGITWSDHYSFWQQNYPAIMLTDTAPFRYPHYHGHEDTVDKICFDHLAIVTSGIKTIIYGLLAPDS